MSANLDPRIFSSIKTLLKLNIGFPIGLFSILSIRQLESLEFAVEYEDPQAKNKHREKVFSNMDEAINFFIEKRSQFQLGFDYGKEIL
jgi:hypothetical protein